MTPQEGQPFHNLPESKQAHLIEAATEAANAEQHELLAPVERKTQETQPTEDRAVTEARKVKADFDANPNPKGKTLDEFVAEHIQPPEATELEAIFHNFKVHHKTLDACFNDAVAVRSIEDTLEAWRHRCTAKVLEELKEQVVPFGHTDDAVTVGAIDAAIQAELTQAHQQKDESNG